MIARYTRKEMGQIFLPEKRFFYMLEVEKAVARAQASLGLIPKKAAAEIQKKGKFQIQKIEEIEKTTKHDVIAFVSNVAENVGPSGKYVHFGMTSSDVLDTALSLQIQDAGFLLIKTLDSLIKETQKLSLRHKKTICSGRTHGMHAEITTFGYKMLGFLFEMKRNKIRLKTSLDQMKIIKLSGAVGTYSSQDSRVEERVAKILNLKRETVATQVIPRDRHAELMSSLALIGSSLERLALELRHLQRTEVMEVIEGFTPGQKGSSAMPHKKNPISSENITGLSRLLRSYVGISLENVALWHERDISHSSTERVMIPDAFILADYAVGRMKDLLKNLYIDAKKMKSNIELSQGQMFTSHILLLLIDKGLSREEAYKLLQASSHSLKPGQSFVSALLKNSEIKKYLSKKEIESVFTGKKHIQAIEKRFQELKNEIHKG